MRPGAQRATATVSGSTTLVASAFVDDAKGTLAVELINGDPSPVTASVDVPSEPADIQSFDVRTSSDGSLWQPSSLAVSGPTVSVEVPGYGVVTLFGQGIGTGGSGGAGGQGAGGVGGSGTGGSSATGKWRSRLQAVGLRRRWRLWMSHRSRIERERSRAFLARGSRVGSAPGYPTAVGGSDQALPCSPPPSTGAESSTSPRKSRISARRAWASLRPRSIKRRVKPPSNKR